MKRAALCAGVGGLLAAAPQFAYADASAADASGKALDPRGRNDAILLKQGAPIEWIIPALDAPEFRLSAYAGKVLVMNVFATRCDPCRDEQPDVVAFAKAHPDDTIVIGVDTGDSDDEVRMWRRNYHIAYPIAMDRADREIRRLMPDGNVVYPTSIVFGPNGSLACAWRGSQPREWFETVRTAALRPSAGSG